MNTPWQHTIRRKKNNCMLHNSTTQQHFNLFLSFTFLQVRMSTWLSAEPPSFVMSEQHLCCLSFQLLHDFDDPPSHHCCSSEHHYESKDKYWRSGYIHHTAQESAKGGFFLFFYLRLL